ncbi:hypothetical protein BpHYR1_045150 [Brachionus plicatilis]|uniref:RNA-directed DNA polymerase from mobile element jockey-like n=1 Tax=Brachionus plicatilis TaxID=10195 RepID=A0A3M7Q856_BRAPC|nr:hypothetical protein BpHYR1_045150 [Brachionus plicatilis]
MKYKYENKNKETENEKKSVQSKVWWDEKLEKIHTEMKQELWSHKASGFKDTRIKKKYKRLKQEFRNKQRKNLKEENSKFVKMMEQNEINDSILDQAIAKFESEIEKKNEEKIVIDRNDIKKIIAMLPNGKSSGFSEASNEMFKYGTSNTLIHLISALIEKIINSGIIPSFFNVGKISPIIKDPNKSKSDFDKINRKNLFHTLI